MDDREKLVDNTATEHGTSMAAAGYSTSAPQDVGKSSDGQGDVGGTVQIQPVTQPMYLPLQQVPYPRSLQEELAQFNFNSSSWTILTNLEAEHSNGRAVGLVHGGLKNVMATAGNAGPELPESYENKYQTLIAGVLLTGERLTANRFDFSKVEFQYILDSTNGVTAQPKPVMTYGRIYLTNQRLLLLSVGDAKDLQLVNNVSCRGEITTKLLSITGSKTSTCRYEGIPLPQIRGVDMSSVCSGTSVTNIKGVIPRVPCCSCFGQTEENWEGMPLTSSTNLNGVINVSVLLPPWNTKCKVVVYMPQNSKVAAAVGFIKALQQSAPGLQV